MEIETILTCLSRELQDNMVFDTNLETRPKNDIEELKVVVVSSNDRNIGTCFQINHRWQHRESDFSIHVQNDSISLLDWHYNNDNITSIAKRFGRVSLGYFRERIVVDSNSEIVFSWLNDFGKTIGSQICKRSCCAFF